MDPWRGGVQAWFCMGAEPCLPRWIRKGNVGHSLLSGLGLCPRNRVQNGVPPASASCLQYTMIAHLKDFRGSSWNNELLCDSAQPEFQFLFLKRGCQTSAYGLFTQANKHKCQWEKLSCMGCATMTEVVGCLCCFVSFSLQDIYPESQLPTFESLSDCYKAPPLHTGSHILRWQAVPKGHSTAQGCSPFSGLTSLNNSLLYLLFGSAFMSCPRPAVPNFWWHAREPWRKPCFPGFR